MHEVSLRLGSSRLQGDLALPSGAIGLVMFAHGSGSSRKSPRNREVAKILEDAGVATFLVDLVTDEEEDETSRVGDGYSFNIEIAAARLVSIAAWLKRETSTRGLRLGLFGAGMGAAATMVAAALMRKRVRALVMRGARADLARGAAPAVTASTLLIVGERDPAVACNRECFAELGTQKELIVVPGAGPTFDEPGALSMVADLTLKWFLRHLEGAQRLEAR